MQATVERGLLATTAGNEMIQNPNCCGSHCRSSVGEVRVLPYVRKMRRYLGGNMILCYHCYAHELAYRRERNRELGEFAQYDLPKWDDLKKYES